MRKTEYHAIGCNENHPLNTTCKENSGYREPEELDIISRLQLQAAATNWSNGGSRVANLLCDAERVIEGLRTQLDTVRSTIEFAKEQGALNEVTYDVLIKAATSGF